MSPSLGLLSELRDARGLRLRLGCLRGLRLRRERKAVPEDGEAQQRDGGRDQRQEQPDVLARRRLLDRDESR